MIQTYIMSQNKAPHFQKRQERMNQCGHCPLLASALCYVNLISASQVWKAWKRGRYPKFNASHLVKFQNRRLRLGAYGDPAMVPVYAIKHILRAVKHYTGYTHQWRNRFAQSWRNHVMASVESTDGKELAHLTGWRTFRVRRADEPLAKHESICPAAEEGGKKTHCIDCCACNGGYGKKNIAIIIHGGAKAPQRFTKLSINGRFLEAA